MAPLVSELKKYQTFTVQVCVSGQHREMLDQVLKFFEINPDFDLDIMRPGQGLFDITTEALRGLYKVVRESMPEWLIVQGDTTTTFVGALAAFYENIKVAHVEAGLRSFNKKAPFPEEMNRILTTHLSDQHFAPTSRARENLLREGVPAMQVHVVGNTSIDALFLCLEKLRGQRTGLGETFKNIRFDKRVILVTGHRRESFGEPFENICQALKTIAQSEDVDVVYPVHLNPNVRKPVFEVLRDLPNVHLIEPLDYPAFVWLMDRSYLILTDSGGVQEEAPSLGKPVLVMREVTERSEGVEAGTAKIVGTDQARIVDEALRLLRDEEQYQRMARAVNPYGDGNACLRIREVLQHVQES